jgi:hypothetical protein
MKTLIFWRILAQLGILLSVMSGAIAADRTQAKMQHASLQVQQTDQPISLPDFKIVPKLILNQITSIEFTPDTPDRYEFSCGINIFRGVVEVQESYNDRSLQIKLPLLCSRE